jgi:hypothetical protein
MYKKRIFIFSILVLLPIISKGQNFYKEKDPKKISIQAGFGAGTFFAAPRPFTDSLVNQVMPVLSLGLGKRLGSHLSLKSIISFQTFANKEYLESDMGQEIVKPLFHGISYAFELTPTFNLMPSFHHMNRPKLDFDLGVGIGYLVTITAEKISF